MGEITVFIVFDVCSFCQLCAAMLVRSDDSIQTAGGDCAKIMKPCRS